MNHKIYSFDSASRNVAPDSSTKDDVDIHNQSIVLEQHDDVNGNDLNEDCQEEPFVYEENRILNWSVDVENDDIEEEQNNDVKENDLNEDYEEIPFVYEENRILDWSVDVENDDIEEEQNDDVKKNDLNENYEEVPFVYEENRILDWTVDVENDDVEEEQNGDVICRSVDTKSDINEEENENSIKVDSSTISENILYESPEVIKYLKEKLYLEALSGHNCLKECVPIVGVLPIIDEESESDEEGDTLKFTTEELIGREEIIARETEKPIVPDVTFEASAPFVDNYYSESTDDVEKITINTGYRIEKDAVTDLTLCTFQPFIAKFSLESGEQIREDITNPIDTDIVSDSSVKPSQPFIENDSLTSAIEPFAQVNEETPNIIDKERTHFPAFGSSQRNSSDNGHITTQRGETFTNDNRFQIKETKLPSSIEDCNLLTPVDKTTLSVENALKSVETDHIINVELQKQTIHEYEKGNVSKQDGIKIKEDLVATDVEQLCSNCDIVTNSNEEGETKNEVCLNMIHSNHDINTPCHILQENTPYGECISEAVVEKRTESNRQIGNKKKEKEIQQL